MSARDILMLFNYATRLTVIESEEDLIFERSLEALSVFADHRKVALYTLAEEKGMLRMEGAFADRLYCPVKIKTSYLNTPFEKVINEKQYGVFPAAVTTASAIPFPVYNSPAPDLTCLLLPLAGPSNEIMGAVTIESNPERDWSVFEIQLFISFATVIAVSLRNSQLYKLATIDGLTGLFVRSFFEIRLSEEIARLRRSGGALSVLLADIDNFKEINDVYGHPHGDTVLKGVADILGSVIRKGVDIPCRYGGDEFTVLIIGAGPKDSLTLAERIKRHCESRVFFMAGDRRKVTVSAGLATMDAGHIINAHEIVERADQMLYKAKDLGRNTICTWE